jgi:hypothetical protein
MGTVFVVLAVTAGCYYVSLRVWPYRPYRPCRRCDGGGRNAGSNAKRFGRCGRCDGSGRGLRLGARILNRRER